MNPSYFRIRLDQAAAMSRRSQWINMPELEPPTEVALSDAVDLACDDQGHWKGSALYIYHNDGWTVFEDLSGHFGAVPADSWQAFAQSEDFILAGYNDAICYGELIVIQNQDVVREFLFDEENPEENVDRGVLPESAIEPIESWIEIASFVDDDSVAYSEKGVLWLHGKTA